MNGAVDISPIFQQIVNPLVQDLALGLIGTGMTWAGFLAKKYLPSWLDAYFETKASADLNTALTNGVTAGMHSLNAWESVHSDVAVQGAVQRFAVQYAINHANDAVERFNLSPEQLATKALAFIPPPPTQPVTMNVHGQDVTIGQPSKVPPKAEADETADLNKESLGGIFTQPPKGTQ